jgi:uncharacterized cupin superfamily protein
MEHVDVEAVEPFVHPSPDTPGGRSISDALGTTEFTLNRYEIAPGEGFSGGMHAHLDQEEVFYVLSGTATFDTEDGQVEVGAGEAIRFEPGEYQHGHNETDDPVVALAIGAPGTRHDWDDIRVPLPCPECGHEALGVAFADDRASFELACPECDATMDPPE